jgi:hypothetical protein
MTGTVDRMAPALAFRAERGGARPVRPMATRSSSGRSCPSRTMGAQRLSSRQPCPDRHAPSRQVRFRAAKCGDAEPPSTLRFVPTPHPRRPRTIACVWSGPRCLATVGSRAGVVSRPSQPVGWGGREAVHCHRNRLPPFEAESTSVDSTAASNNGLDHQYTDRTGFRQITDTRPSVGCRQACTGMCSSGSRLWRPSRLPSGLRARDRRRYGESGEVTRPPRARLQGGDSLNTMRPSPTRTPPESGGASGGAPVAKIPSRVHLPCPDPGPAAHQFPSPGTASVTP